MAKKAKQKKAPTAHQKLARKAAKNPLYNPAAVLSGLPLKQAANTLANVEVNPQLHALGRESSTLTKQGTALLDRGRDYYSQLATREADAVARQRALGASLSSSLSGIEAQTGSALSAAEKAAQDRQAADTALRGPGLSGGGDEQLTRELAAQRARAAGSAQTYKSDAALQTGNYGELENTLAGARQLRGAEFQQETSNRIAGEQRDIAGKRADIAGSKGGLALKHLLDLRQSGFENIATVKGLGLKESQIQAEIDKARAEEKLAGQKQHEVARHNRAGESNTRRGQNVTKRGQDLSHQDRQAARGKGGGGLTRAVRVRGQTQLGKARSLLGAYSTHQLSKTGQAKIVALLSGKGIDSDIALAAFQERIYHGWGPHTRHTLKHRYGLKHHGYPSQNWAPGAGR